MDISETLDTHEAQRPQRIRQWLERAVLVAYDQGQLSEGQASAVLGVDRITLREMIATWRESQPKGYAGYRSLIDGLNSRLRQVQEDSPPDDSIEHVWQEFWQPIVAPNGLLDLEQVKRELYDYRRVMREVSLVYDTVTNGRISKPNTAAEAVIGEFEDYIEAILRDERGAVDHD